MFLIKAQSFRFRIDNDGECRDILGRVVTFLERMRQHKASDALSPIFGIDGQSRQKRGWHGMARQPAQNFRGKRIERDVTHGKAVVGDYPAAVVLVFRNKNARKPPGLGLASVTFEKVVERLVSAVESLPVVDMLVQGRKPADHARPDSSSLFAAFFNLSLGCPGVSRA